MVLVFVTLVSILTEVPKLARETFKAIKPGLSAYADDPDQVESPQHSPTPAEASITDVTYGTHCNDLLMKWDEAFQSTSEWDEGFMST